MAFIVFDPQQWVNPSIAGIAVGSILLLLGITGGDAEIKEIHIPKVEGIWRAASLISGFLLFLFGAGVVGNIAATPGTRADVTKPAEAAKTGEPAKTTEPIKATEPVKAESVVTASPSPASPSDSLVPTQEIDQVPRARIQVIDRIADQSEWEVVDIKVGAAPQVRISSSEASPQSTVSFDVPKAGNVNYSINYLVKREMGVRKRFFGKGRISAEDSLVFKVATDNEGGGHVYLSPNRGHVP